MSGEDLGGLPFEDDVELRQQFVEEAQTRLSSLTDQLLQLENSGSGAELIASMFRDAHTLKGLAGMVGLDHVARAAHALEDVLERLRRGSAVVTPDLIDVLLNATDGLGSIVWQALAGTDHAEGADTLERKLREALDRLQPASATTESAAPAPALAAPAPTLQTPWLPHSQTKTYASSRGAAPDRPEEPNTLQVSVERLDKLVRLVGESAGAQLRLGRLIKQKLNTEPDAMPEFRDLARLLNELQETTMRARMVPVSTVTHSLQRAVRDVARSTGKSISWEVRGESTEIDRRVLEQLSDPLIHLVRNAVAHGIELPEERVAAGKEALGKVRLHAMQLGSEVIIAITDDGRGIDVDRVREEATQAGMEVSHLSDDEALLLIFRSGLTTATTLTNVSGRGVGLDVVHSQLDAVRGRIEVHTEPGKGSEFRIAVPITLAILSCLLVQVGGQRFALPLHSVLSVLDKDSLITTSADGQSQLVLGNQPVVISSLASTLGNENANGRGPVVVVAGPTRRHAFQVESLQGKRDVVVKGLGRLVPRLRAIAGASVEPDGSILVILESAGLIDLARRQRIGLDTQASGPGPSKATKTTKTAAEPDGRSKATILVVDDALAVREFQRTILERAGYGVRTANDGSEGLELLSEVHCDLVLTDVEMPRMNGFELTKAIRADSRLQTTPVLILTSRADEEDRQHGMEAGADGYFIKSAFDQTALLGAVERLLGTSR